VWYGGCLGGAGIGSGQCVEKAGDGTHCECALSEGERDFCAKGWGCHSNGEGGVKGWVNGRMEVERGDVCCALSRVVV
jgi:hypothetical protein